jgi:hypothetical protein
VPQRGEIPMRRLMQSRKMSEGGCALSCIDLRIGTEVDTDG